MLFSIRSHCVVTNEPIIIAQKDMCCNRSMSNCRRIREKGHFLRKAGQERPCEKCELQFWKNEFMLAR